MRLVTRGDLDGLTCAVLLSLNEEIDSISLIHPQDISDGRADIREGDIIANLPYNIATPLLIGWLRQAGAFERMTLMFQQEVAERICASPDTAAFGRLSVLSQWLTDVRPIHRFPQPPNEPFSMPPGMIVHKEFADKAVKIAG